MTTNNTDAAAAISSASLASLAPLVARLRAANQAYGIGQPFLTDEQYDELWRAIYELDPTCDDLHHTSRDPSTTDRRAHPLPLMGTQRAFELQELAPFYQRYAHLPWRIEPKYDGVCAVLYPPPPDHEQHYLALLEGDGRSGRDISHHLPHIQLPEHHGPRLPVELVIPWSHWLDSYGANPRNTVAGWIASGSKPAEHPGIIHAVSHNRSVLLSHTLSDPSSLALDELEVLLLARYDTWKASFPIDGLMIKLASARDRLRVSHNGTVYLWCIAWKPPMQTAQTRVEAVEWNVSRTGRVVPRVRYAPVELCSTTNRYATANNATWLRERGITPGCTITLGKAGEIIPKIISVESPFEATLPCDCPVCEAPLTRSGVDLVCLSADCIAQTIARLEHFYSDKAMELKSIGSAMIEQLLQDPGVASTLKASPWALLTPEHFNLLGAIYAAWGQARTDTYLANLEELSGAKNAAHLMAGLGYKALAYKSALELLQELSGHAPHRRRKPQAMQSFILALAEVQRAQSELGSFELAPIPAAPQIRYAITGTLSIGRKEMEMRLAELDWQPMNQVSKFTDFLLVGELPKPSTKLIAAQEHGIEQLTERELERRLCHEDQEDPS